LGQRNDGKKTSARRRHDAAHALDDGCVRLCIHTAKGNGRLADLYSRRDNLLAAIKEVEFDHAMSKISVEDFNDMHARYRQDAVAVLKRIDALNGGNGGLALGPGFLVKSCRILANTSVEYSSICALFSFSRTAPSI
jgi:hypothetical protein